MYIELDISIHCPRYIAAIEMDVKVNVEYW